jgi:hypothetical protein
LIETGGHRPDWRGTPANGAPPARRDLLEPVLAPFDCDCDDAFATLSLALEESPDFAMALAIGANSAPA